MVSGQSGAGTGTQPLVTATQPDGTTLRDGYTCKEAQNRDFNTSYTDFGARQYSPALRRWMTPDPLSEKHYGISPYAFCNNNPVNLVDPDGGKVRLADNSTPEFKLKFYQNLLYMISGHAARYDEAVKNGTITQWLSGCENDESNPYDNHEDEIVITTTEQVVAKKKHGEICEGQVTRTDHSGKQVQRDVSNKSPWEIQKDIYEHNELLK
jgi:RHS repeat-associated protein